MAEWATNGKGNLGVALGSIGTGLGILNNGMGLLGGLGRGGAYEVQGACMHDVDMAQKLAQKDSEISQLKGERYTNNAVIDLYKYVNSELTSMKEKAAANWTDQAVINANVSTGITTLKGQVDGIASTVAGITKTAVPSSAICNFGCGGCGATSII